MGQRGAGAEYADQTQQRFGLFGVVGRPVDTGEIRGQIHHNPVAELHQIGAARMQIPIQNGRHGRREHVLLVVTEESAFEHAKLHHAAKRVFLAMQGEQHIAHHRAAVVVQRLHHMRVLEHLHRAGIVTDADHGVSKQTG